MVRIVTDSSAELLEEWIKQYNISIVPLTITLEGKEYREGINITSKEFSEKMLQSHTLPKTSQPSPDSFKKVFDELAKEDEVLCLTLSSGLSGTYQSACIGKDMSNSSSITVYDTLTGSLGQGFMVIKAAQLVKEGVSVKDIVQKLEAYREHINIVVLLNTLENVIKGGRLNKFSGSIAKFLNLKILLHEINGKIELLDKIRGKKKALRATFEEIASRKKDFSNSIFGITHVDNMEDAEYIKEEIIKRFNPKDVFINYMGATLATYAGKDGIVISFD